MNIEQYIKLLGYFKRFGWNHVYDHALDLKRSTFDKYVIELMVYKFLDVRIRQSGYTENQKEMLYSVMKEIQDRTIFADRFFGKLPTRPFSSNPHLNDLRFNIERINDVNTSLFHNNMHNALFKATAEREDSLNRVIMFSIIITHVNNLIAKFAMAGSDEEARRIIPHPSLANYYNKLANDIEKELRKPDVSFKDESPSVRELGERTVFYD